MNLKHSIFKICLSMFYLIKYLLLMQLNTILTLIDEMYE